MPFFAFIVFLFVVYAVVPVIAVPNTLPITAPGILATTEPNTAPPVAPDIAAETIVGMFTTIFRFFYCFSLIV